MITVYVLLSLEDGATYVGMASDASKRLKEHNHGKNRYTKGTYPGKLFIPNTTLIGLQQA
jgi:predicted GIY-YIG superfamily endonuclease